MASKNKLARLTLSVLSATAILATAACGSSSGTAGSTASASTDEWSKTGPINYVQGKDTSGYVQGILDKWNALHADQKVTLVELSDSADEQRAAMIKNAESKGASNYDVLSVDVVWTAEFAANGYLAQLPTTLDTTGYLKAAVDSATYFNKLYAFPSTSDGALLYYRKDLLDAAGLKVPTTWADMKTACAKIKTTNPTIDCYGGQFQKYEGLTCNFAEMVNSAGGAFLAADGTPTVNTDKAVAGVQWAVDAFKDGTIPKAALTWKEEESRTAFQNGKPRLPPQLAVRVHAGPEDRRFVEGRRQVRRRADPGPERSWRVHPRWPQHGRLEVLAEQGHRARVPEVVQQPGEPEGQHAGELERSDVDRSVHRCRPDQQVRVPAGSEGVDRQCSGSPEGREVRRRHPGDPGCRVQRTQRNDCAEGGHGRPPDEAHSSRQVRHH